MNGDGWIMADGDGSYAQVYLELSQLQGDLLVPEAEFEEGFERGFVLEDEALKRIWHVAQAHRVQAQSIADPYEGASSIPAEVAQEFETHKRIMTTASTLFSAQLIMQHHYLAGMVIGVFKGWQIGWCRPIVYALLHPDGDGFIPA